jgi:hypothetical protein
MKSTCHFVTVKGNHLCVKDDILPHFPRPRFARQPQRRPNEVMYGMSVVRGIAFAFAEYGDMRRSVRADLDVNLRPLAIVLGLGPYSVSAVEKVQCMRAAQALL